MSVSSNQSTRKRGRKAGDIVDTPKSKRAAFLKEKGSSEDDIFNPAVAPIHTRSKDKLPTVSDMGKDMQAKPTQELGACIKDQLIVVEKIADSLKNVKGNKVQALLVAVRTVEAAAVELAERTAVNVNVERLEKENNELRSEMAELNTKLEALVAEVRRPSHDSTAKSGMPSSAFAPEASDRVQLMADISALMDRKLAEFKADLIAAPSSVARKDILPSEKDERHDEATNKASRKAGKKKAKSQNIPTTAPVDEVPAGISGPIESHVPSTLESAWATVTGRKRNKPLPVKAVLPPKPTQIKVVPVAKAKLQRLPTSAAITVTVPEGSDVTYAMVMTAAKQRVKLAECGIDSVRTKRALTGGLILEVSGADCTSKADVLAERMREALSDLGVRIARPVKTSDIRIMDLDEAVTPEEVAEAIAKAGDCSVANVKVGDIRRSSTRLGTAWVRCPLTAARKIVMARNILIGWISARVERLDPRPLQCFRCLETGHVRSMCTSETDRSNRCYACGDTDHRANHCTHPLKCPVCSDLGRPSDHRMGSKKCTPPKGNKGKETTPPSRVDKAQAQQLDGNQAPKSKGLLRSGNDLPEEPMEAT